MIRKVLWLIPLCWVLVFTGARWLHPGPLEYGEGVSLHWQQQVEAGQPVYPPVREDQLPWVHNPYPPLGPVLSATVDTLLPLPHLFAAGRGLSLLGIFGAAAVMVWGLSDAETRSRRWWIALLFLASPMTLRAGSLMRVDALALFASLVSFFILKQGTHSWRWLVSGLFAGGAVLLKPTFCAAGLVLVVRLIREREWSSWVQACLGVALPCLTIGGWIFSRENPQLALHLLDLQALPRLPEEALKLFAGFCSTHGFLIAAGLVMMCVSGRSLREERLYLIGALLVLGATVSIEGAHSGYFLEVWALCCLAVARFPVDKQPQVAWIVGLQFLLFIPWEAPPVFSRTYGQEEEPGKVQAFWPGEQDRQMVHALQEELRTADGPVLSTSPGLVLMAERDLTVQLFQFSALMESGDWDPALLADAITFQEFDRILLKGNAERGDDPYLPAELQALVGEHYSLHRALGPWHLYRR